MVSESIEKMPLRRFPGPVDAMDLLETIAYKGVRLPAPLLMLRKVLFTLDGILHDVAGADISMDFVMTQRLFQNWISGWANFGSPLFFRDWLLVQSSAALYPSRLLVQWQQKALQRPQGKRPRKSRVRNPLRQRVAENNQSRRSDLLDKQRVLETT